jgi:hypothetical protein
MLDTERARELGRRAVTGGPKRHRPARGRAGGVFRQSMRVGGSCP